MRFCFLAFLCFPLPCCTYYISPIENINNDAGAEQDSQGSVPDAGAIIPFVDASLEDAESNNDLHCKNVNDNLCQSHCTDMRNDNDNCGACGTKCAAGYSCRDWQCLLDCPSINLCANFNGDNCFNPLEDPMFCGLHCYATVVCTKGQTCLNGSCI